MAILNFELLATPILSCSVLNLSFVIRNSKLENSKSQAKPRTIQHSKLKIQNWRSQQFKTQNSKFKIQYLRTSSQILLLKSSTKKFVLEKINPLTLAFFNFSTAFSEAFLQENDYDCCKTIGFVAQYLLFCSANQLPLLGKTIGIAV